MVLRPHGDRFHPGNTRLHVSRAASGEEDRPSIRYLLAGVVLYEMATGVHPFLKDSTLETINAIVSTPFPAPSEHMRDAPPSLQRTLEKMMAKKANRRFGTFAEVQGSLGRLLEDVKATGFRIFFRDLLSPGVVLTAAAVLVLGILFVSFLSLDRSVREEARRDQGLELAGVPVDPNPRIAVLPLVHLGPNDKDDVLGQGLTDSLITRLANVRGLSVISQPSVMYFKEEAWPFLRSRRNCGQTTY